jgi:hypothetical protein
MPLSQETFLKADFNDSIGLKSFQEGELRYTPNGHSSGLMGHGWSRFLVYEQSFYELTP